MSRIIKWLTENGIKFEVKHSKYHSDFVAIMLEEGCVWVNGFGEDMVYDRMITIHQDTTYKNYYVKSVVGYNRVENLFKGTRAKDVIEVLAELDYLPRV